jgi:hypothetical protein
MIVATSFVCEAAAGIAISRQVKSFWRERISNPHCEFCDKESSTLQAEGDSLVSSALVCME